MDAYITRKSGFQSTSIVETNLSGVVLTDKIARSDKYYSKAIIDTRKDVSAVIISCNVFETFATVGSGRVKVAASVVLLKNFNDRYIEGAEASEVKDRIFIYSGVPLSNAIDGKDIIQVSCEGAENEDEVKEKMSNLSELVDEIGFVIDETKAATVETLINDIYNLCGSTETPPTVSDPSVAGICAIVYDGYDDNGDYHASYAYEDVKRVVNEYLYDRKLILKADASKLAFTSDIVHGETGNRLAESIIIY